jgi:SnoaL-like domain
MPPMTAPAARVVVLLLFIVAFGPTSAATAPTPPVPPPGPAAAQVDSDAAVSASLDSMNPLLARRDLPGFMALFEDTDDILLVGSDTGEVFRGRARVAGFLKQLYALPFTFSFDMTNVTIQRHADSAWAFVGGAMVHTAADGTATKRPYRFSIAMVKVGQTWRWQLFHGSVPGGE